MAVPNDLVTHECLACGAIQETWGSGATYEEIEHSAEVTVVQKFGWEFVPSGALLCPDCS